jgi:hypothetical protein
MSKRFFKSLPSKKGKRLQIPPTPPINSGLLKPIFSFHYMTYCGSTCLSKCEKADCADFANRLLELSQLSWNDIISKRYAGYEKIPRHQFKNPIPTSITEDVDKLVVFNFSCAGRMAGFQRGNIYHIVQVSPTHDLY